MFRKQLLILSLHELNDLFDEIENGPFRPGIENCLIRLYIVVVA